MGRRKRAEYAADTETTTDPEDCRVWAWGVAKVGAPDTFEYGTDLDGLMEYMSAHPGRYWFHNLKFDVAFIFVWLHDHGYRLVKERPKEGEYTALVDSLGKIYRVGIGPHVVLADSLKKIQMSVAEVARTYGLAYGKGEIDYDAPREPGHMLTPEEHEYLRRDVCIMATALAQRLADGGKLTTASDCLETYRDMCGKSFDRYFPKLNDIMDTYLRDAYFGGWVYVNPKHRGKTVSGGGRLDVNSLYPWALSCCDMPIGTPTYFTGAPPRDGGYWVARVTLTASLKPDGIPCIQTKAAKLFGSAEYATAIEEPQTFTVCNIDFGLWLEQYDVDVIAWHGGYRFEHTGGLFTDYVEHFMAIKANSEGGARYQAKLFMNSLYGRFGLKIHIQGKHPVVDNERVLHYVSDPATTREGVYLPVAVFVTAHARCKTIRAAREFGERFCYADTDSIHYLGKDIPADVEVHPTKLGAWKLEARFTRARFVRPKTYAEVEEGAHAEFKCAGMSDALKSIMRFDDFKVGFFTPACSHCGGNCQKCYANTAFWGLRPKNVPGGVVLVPSPFSIK